MPLRGAMKKLSVLLTSLSLVTSRAFLHTISSLTKNTSSSQSHLSEVQKDRKLFSAAAEKITLEKMVESLREGMYKNILVVAGAGISCSAGIPDVSCCASFVMWCMRMC
jgi:hypothetical protein